jgi:diguanylate cyclase (GGDEF)-like protein/PAS domain S-box-containing protein
MPVRQTDIDDHSAEYWARQLRIGIIIAVAVTAIGGVRIAVDWAAADRWWLIPVAAAVAGQAATLGLPWQRLVRRRPVRDGLLAWWFAEMPVMTLFGLADPDGTLLYATAGMLLLFTAAAFWSPAVIALFGGLTLAGFCAVSVHNHDRLSTTLVLVAMNACLCALTVIHAQNRRRLDGRRLVAEQRAVTLLAASADAVLAVGPDYRITYASPSIRGLLGVEGERLIGCRPSAVLEADDWPAIRAWIAAMFASERGHTGRFESRLRRPGGTWVYVDIIGTNWLADPDLGAVVVSLRDIGARRALEEQLSAQAYTDSLTGMPNRALFRRRLAEAVAGEGAATPVTVLLLDVDDFKLVNDDLGHSAGDELLTTIAGRLRDQVRPSDTLARLGGDEFAVLLTDLDPADAAALAERLLEAAREPIRLGSRDVTCSLSIGIARVVPGDGSTGAEQVLGNADLAMYAAKRGGRNAYAEFDASMSMSVLKEAQQRADLEHALENDEFRVLYQPVVDMQTQRLTAVEALVRWEHPRDGLLGPYHFIGNAEANGLIVPLGRWVLREACAQLASWRAAAPAAATLKVNVNLSARQFQYAGLVDDVADAIADGGIDAASLTLEITESMLMTDIEGAIQTLHALRGLGVRLAIDDFGTGYSSLSYLKRLPVDVIKIDKTFVDQVDTDADDVALVDAVAGLGQALKMQTVAEGIETDAQWAMLRRIGIDHGQGYLFGRPVPAACIAELLAAGTMAAGTVAAAV